MFPFALITLPFMGLALLVSEEEASSPPPPPRERMGLLPPGTGTAARMGQSFNAALLSPPGSMANRFAIDSGAHDAYTLRMQGKDPGEKGFALIRASRGGSLGSGWGQFWPYDRLAPDARGPEGTAFERGCASMSERPLVAESFGGHGPPRQFVVRYRGSAGGPPRRDLEEIHAAGKVVDETPRMLLVEGDDDAMVELARSLAPRWRVTPELRLPLASPRKEYVCHRGNAEQQDLVEGLFTEVSRRNPSDPPSCVELWKDGSLHVIWGGCVMQGGRSIPSSYKGHPVHDHQEGIVPWRNPMSDLPEPVAEVIRGRR